MVIMQGTKRYFDPIFVETSSSSTTRTVTIFGVESYNDLLNMVISIKSNASGIEASSTLNVNNLGVKNLKFIDENGISINPFEGWTASGKIYQVYYNGVEFIVCDFKTKDKSPYNDHSYIDDASSMLDIPDGVYLINDDPVPSVLDFHSHMGTVGRLEVLTTGESNGEPTSKTLLFYPAGHGWGSIYGRSVDDVDPDNYWVKFEGTPIPPGSN